MSNKLLIWLTIATFGAVAALPASAAKKKDDKKAPAATAPGDAHRAEPEPAKPEPAKVEPAKTQPTAPEPSRTEEKRTVAPTSPFDAAPEPAAPPKVVNEPYAETQPLLLRRDKSTFEGFFLGLNLGYATHGGQDGPVIPDMTAGQSSLGVSYDSFAAWKAAGCLYAGKACYNRAITTARGQGAAANVQIGYNIKGYVSLWLDLAWHGTFGSTADMAGVGTASAMLGLHPLRFLRDDLPVDLKLYGGYGFFEILYYYETEFQTEAKGKAWTGTSLPFGLHTEYKFDRNGVFALGVDLRAVKGSYTKWIYNNDKDFASRFESDPVTTLRFEPRLTFGWHF